VFEGTPGNSGIGRNGGRGHRPPVGPRTAVVARSDRLVGPSPKPGPRRAVAGTQPHSGGRDLLEQMRRMALFLETAEVLELRASRSANAMLAGLLRERAAERRRVGERFRADLLRDGFVTERRGDRWGQLPHFRCMRTDGGPGQR
jgi:hypothetical protein